MSPHLWRPSDLRYVPEAGFSCGLRKIERLMRSQALRAATQARPAERRRRTLGLGDRAECARSPVHGGPAQPQMDCRLHLPLDSRGLALCRRSGRSVFAPRSRLVNEGRDERAARHRRVVNGDLAARAPGCVVASLRPGQPIHERAVPAADGRQWRRLFDEPFRHGKLLLVAENRTERIGRKVYRTRDAAGPTCSTTSRRFYNTIRRHSTNGYLSPVEFERKVGLA